MIEVEGLCKYFYSFKMSDVSFKLPKGYICGVVGKTGSGKSTLIKLLSGVYKQSKGEISIAGMNYNDNEKELRSKIALISDEFSFIDNVKVKNIPKMYSGLYYDFNAKRFSEYINKFNINDKCEFGKLSRGNKLMVQLAFAMSREANVYLFDEPTSNLDENNRKLFWDMCSELIENEDNTIIIASHITDDLDKKADYILYLDEGRKLLFDNIENIKEKYKLVKAENYKLKLIGKEYMVCLEEGEYSGKALVKINDKIKSDKDYIISDVNIQEFMYFVSKAGKSFVVE